MGKHDLYNKEDFLSESKEDHLSEDEKKKKDQPSPSKEEETDRQEEDMFKGTDDDISSIDPELEEELKEVDTPDKDIDEDYEEPEHRRSMSADLDEKLDRALEEFQDEDEEEYESLEDDNIEDFSAGDEEEESAPPPRQPSIEDYEDDKQTAVSYKPFYIGGAVVVILVVVFFLVRTLFLSGDKQQPAETVKDTKPAAEETLTEAERARNAFYGALAHKAQTKINLISNINNHINGNNLRLSSLLIYGQECLFEAFSRDREGLAKLNIRFKEQMKQSKFTLLTSKLRAGESGGVFGIYKLELNDTGAGKENVSQTLASKADLKSWIENLAANHNLSINQTSFLRSGEQDNYRVETLQTAFDGSLNQCVDFLKSIGQANKNLSLHKTKLMASNQKTLSSKRYALTLVLQLYI